MQTTAALVGLYAVVYIYATQRIKHPIDQAKINFSLDFPPHKIKLTWPKTTHLSGEYKEFVESAKKTFQDYGGLFQDSEELYEHFQDHVKRCEVLEEKYRKTHKYSSVIFIILLFLGTGTILSNAIWLKLIIEKPDMIFPILGEISFFLFTFTLILIFVDSILTVIFSTSYQELLNIYQELVNVYPDLQSFWTVFEDFKKQLEDIKGEIEKLDGKIEENI